MTEPETPVFSSRRTESLVDQALSGAVNDNPLAVTSAVAPLFIFGNSADRYRFTAAMIHHVADTIPRSCPCDNPEHNAPQMVIGYAKHLGDDEWEVARDEEGNETTPLELQIMAPEIIIVMEMLKADVMGDLAESARLYASAKASEIEPDVVAASIKLACDQLRPLLRGL